MNRKAILIAGTLILVLGAGSLYSLPYVAIYRIIAAMETKDTHLLSELVDFNMIRKDLKNLAGKKFQSGPVGTKPDARGPTQKSVTSLIIAGAVEELITPEGLISFMQQRLDALAAIQDGTDKTKPTAWQMFVALVGHADLAYTSPSEFIIAFKTSDGGWIRFVLSRNGMAWRLTNLEF